MKFLLKPHQKLNCSRLASIQRRDWERRYKRNTRIELEKHWKEKFKERLENSTNNEKKKKFYCLSMFPYPSGKLHMGHVRVYTISDTFSHFYRMNGYDVVHPMGWDAFGLPAENAARDRNLDPAEWTQSNIAYMKEQLKNLNLFFDWDREISTCDGEYYKWTQYLFIKLFEAGLAYQNFAQVNWDPVDKTVLADEQVDENGCSWRSGAVVEKKYLKQWFFRTSVYAESLLNSLDDIDEDVGIKAMQKNWIGKVNGCQFNFQLHFDQSSVKDFSQISSKSCLSIPVFCFHPESVFGASHVILRHDDKDQLAHLLEHHGATSLSSQILDDTNEDCLITGCFVKNPFTGVELPLIVSKDYEREEMKVPMLLGIPDTNEIDKNLADKFSLPYKTVISKETIINSSKYSGMTIDEARKEILEDSREMGFSSGIMTTCKLRDWLISRQRSWGTPIPIIHCPVHGAVPVPYEDLPVKLSQMSGEDLNVSSCPKCGRESKRETDTMDTFVDSSWYFLRYCDPHHSNSPYSKSKADSLMPVDLYIGGKEHATLHLYYARFFSHFLADQGMHTCREPFKKILAQGIIKGLTYQVESSGRYVPPSEVDDSGSAPVSKDTGEVVTPSFQKMSKSKFNGVDPEEFVSEWGISITRLYVLYAAAPFEDIHWDVKTDVIPGVMRWQLKCWTCVTKILDARNKIPRDKIEPKKSPLTMLQKNDELAHHANKLISEITNHYSKDCVLSAAITCLMVLAKILIRTPEKVIQQSAEFEHALCSLVIMSAPMTPHFASELWSGLRQMRYKLSDHDWEKDVLDQKWPRPQLTNMFDLVEYKIQVNGKTCYGVRLPSDTKEMNNEIETNVMSLKRVQKQIRGHDVENLIIDNDRKVIRISIL